MNNTDEVWGLKAHPAADLFPLMAGDEFNSLCQDIKERGQQEPIVLYEGKILDGRNRFNACKKIGQLPETVSRSVDDPIAFAVSANVRRRHLDANQLGALGAEVEHLYAEEAKKRMSAGGGDKKSVNAPEKSGVAQGPHPIGDQHKSRNQAAAVVGASGRSVQRAKLVKEKGCDELYQAVKDGKVNLTTAERVAKQIPTKKTQRAVVLSALTADDPNEALRVHASDGGATASGKSRPVGVLRANEAVDCLMRIPKNDPHRERGFQIVSDWIKGHK